MLALHRVENDEVIPIVYTKHSHTYLCMPLQTVGSAETQMGWSKFLEGWGIFFSPSHSTKLFFFLLKVIKINPINARMKTLLVFARLSPQKPKHSHSSMSSVNRTVALSNTDHDRPLSCFGFCSHHLQARWCEIGHCDPFFRIRRKLSAGLLVSSLFMSSSGAHDN